MEASTSSFAFVSSSRLVAGSVVVVVVGADNGGGVDFDNSVVDDEHDDDVLNASIPSPTDVVNNDCTAEGEDVIMVATEGVDVIMGALEEPRGGVDAGAMGTGTPMSADSVLSADAMI